MHDALGGFRVGDRAYNAGVSETLPTGFHLAHGAPGEVVDRATTGINAGNRLVLRFSDVLVNMPFARLSRSPPPPLPGGFRVGECLYSTGWSVARNCLMEGVEGEVMGPVPKDFGEARSFQNNFDDRIALRFDGEPHLLVMSLKCLSRSPPVRPGDTPLTAAAFYGRTNELRALLDGGADPDETSTADEDSALDISSWKGRVDCVSALLDAGADVDPKALATACSYGHSSIASLLLDAGANMNRQDDEGRPPLWYAIMNDHIDCVQLLISRGASRTFASWASAFATSHETAYDTAEMAQAEGQSGAVAAFLTATRGWTPLHYLRAPAGAVSLPTFATLDAARASVLLRSGAVLHATADNGETPLSIACAMASSGVAPEGSAAALVVLASQPFGRETCKLYPAAACARAAVLLFELHLLARRWGGANCSALFDAAEMHVLAGIERDTA